MPILTIIDMQEWFLDNLNDGDFTLSKSGYDFLIDNVISLVKIFKKHNQPIVSVLYNIEHGFDLYSKEDKKEYEGMFGVHEHIKAEIGNYDKHHIKWKNTDSGAIQINNVVKKNNYDKNIYMCGVNATACVMDTYTKLTRSLRYENVNVIHEATRNVYDEYPSNLIYRDALSVKEIDKLLTYSE